MNSPDTTRYLTPSQQPTANKTASERAKHQKALAETFNTQGRTESGGMRKNDSLERGGLIPSAFTKNKEGKTEITSAIERNPDTYRTLFDDAEKNAQNMLLRYELFDGPLSDEQKALIHCQCIQNAINEHIRPDQSQAERNMEQLTEEKSEDGATVIDLNEVKKRKAEVCTTKTLITQHYLQEHCPEIKSTMTVTTPENGQEGHAYLELSGALCTAFHPNSPMRAIHGGYLPNFERMSAEQQAFLMNMHAHQKQNAA